MDQSRTQQMIEALTVGERAALRRGLLSLAGQFRQARLDLRNRLDAQPAPPDRPSAAGTAQLPSVHAVGF